jgi:hypothetical protein
MNKRSSIDGMSGLSLCKSLGQRAHRLRLDIIINPYTRDSEKWDAFNKGWLEAVQESKTFIATAA